VTDSPSARDDVAFVALGSNLGDRARHLSDALRRITALPGVMLLAASRIEETAPLGPTAQGAYFNQMIALRTTLTPPDLLDRLLEIEQAGGRVRDVRWGARTIDLDIVRYARTTWNDARLTVPHAELQHRDFWQRELAELDAALADLPSSVS
jgi:2-amino-4-hydroxy-6-hydroxymethyldihydropteridine diphosphokinase